MNSFKKLGLCVITAASFGCASGKDDGGGPGGTGDFVSSNPSAAQANRSGPTLAEGDAASGAGGSNAAPGAPSADDGGAARAIEEADIIKLGEGKLYALSQYGGLSVIDVSTRDELELLGRFKTDAMPFEMYLRGSVVLALFNDYGAYEIDEATGNYIWTQSSRVLALDVSNPASIEELGSFRIPGSISDSRIVGDVLYVVGYQDQFCWGCDTSSPGTTIMSLDISDPMMVTKVDELRYNDSQNEWGWWRRSVTVTEDRMYVAGVEYGSDQALGSTIHVIDISDPAGTLEAGSRVEAEGEISSRWQMDEFEGVLRVISQPPQWDPTRPPVIQTWRVDSADSLTRLGRAEMVLPRPEQLQAVRFDGPRGYAITFQQTDPLFTIDLSNPEQPVQAGELEMPGWVYHMEPRGDRVLGLGFDQGNPEGSVTVSLFDVTNLAAPTMIDRVNFGGDWGNLAEDQDRIHKAFNVMDEIGMILVPFSGYNYVESDIYGCGSYQSGVQLIDWADDSLTLRGVAESVGQARRGFLHDERLFTVSDERVQTFDIADRDAPAETAELPLLTNVSQSAVVGDHVVRLSSDWWTSAPRLEVTTLAGASSPIPLGSLDLADVIGGQTERGCSWYGWYPRKLFSNGHYAYVLYESYGSTSYHMNVAVIDVSDPTAPTLVGEHALPSVSNGSYYYYGGGNLAPSGSDIVQIDTTLALLRTEYEYDEINYETTRVRTFVDVIDLSDPTAPQSQTIEMPVGLGTTGLIVSGNQVVMSHFEAANESVSVVRFYLDRIDVSNGGAPVRLPSINIPGSLLAYDAATSGAVTVDYTAHSQQTLDQTQCSETFRNAGVFQPYDTVNWTGPGTCTAIQQSLKLVRLGTIASVEGAYELPIGEFVSQSTSGDDRTFVTLSNWSYYYGFVGDCLDCGYGYYGGGPNRQLPLITIGGISSGDYAAGRVDIDGGDYWSYVSGLVASGQRVLLSSGWRGELSVIDASSAAEPVVVKSVPIHGYVSDLDVADNGIALASLGYDGAELVYIGD